MGPRLAFVAWLSSVASVSGSRLKKSGSQLALPPLIGPEIAPWKGDAVVQDIDLAVAESNVWISAAIRGLDDADEELVLWFGEANAEVKTTVKNMLFRMLHAVSNLYVAKGAKRECTTDVLAYVMGAGHSQKNPKKDWPETHSGWGEDMGPGQGYWRVEAQVHHVLLRPLV